MSRPRSPWPGSRYESRHRWQLDVVSDLPDAGAQLRRLAAELTAAHAAGWWLTEPMRSGHLVAARASRRQRAVAPAGSTDLGDDGPPPVVAWRLRVVDEQPVAGQEVFSAETAVRTPVVAWRSGSIEQVSGPDVAPDVLADTAGQVAPLDPGQRRWGLAPARVGPNFDLVAHGSGLRLHAVRDGVLVRTQEALSFQHAADGTRTLARAAGAYLRLAHTAEAMVAAGGRLTGSDDGLLYVAYDRTP